MVGRGGSLAGGVRILVASLLTVSILLVGLPGVPARAGVHNPVPTNELMEPTYVFRADEPLFAYYTTDLTGGWLCIVPTTGSDHTCRDSDRWGGANFVFGVGSGHIPIAGAYLKVGNWRILAESTEGGKQFSDVFTVQSCLSECDRSMSDAILEKWKTAAAHMQEGGNKACDGFDLWDLYPEAVETKTGITGEQAEAVVESGQQMFDHVQVARHAVGDLLGMAKRTTRLKTVATSGPATNLVMTGTSQVVAIPAPLTYHTYYDQAQALVKIFACMTAMMYADIVADPPDPNFRDVPEVDLRPVPDPGPQAGWELAKAMERQRAYGAAHLQAFERYLAADGVSGDRTRAQLEAVAEYGYELVEAQRDSAKILRTFASELSAHPALEPTIFPTQEIKDLVLALRARVRDDGFLPEERDSLAAQGLTNHDLEQVRSGMTRDVSHIPVGQSASQLLLDAADAFETHADAFDEFSRFADSVGDAYNLSPLPAFQVEALSRYEYRFRSLSTSPDGDDLILEWDLGDGNTATGEEVVHTYAADGTYSVKLRASDPLETAEHTRDVTTVPCCQPSVSFDVDPAAIRVGEPVTYTSTATAHGRDIIEWSWEFPGGVIKTGPTVQHTWLTPGNHPLYHRVLDSEGETVYTIENQYVLPDSLTSVGGCSSTTATSDSQGTEFLLAYPPGGGGFGGTPVLFITGPTATSGVVEIPGIGFQQAFTVTPGSETRVQLPTEPFTSGGTYVDAPDLVTAAAIRVCADDEIAVVQFDDRGYASEGTLAIPVDRLGTDHIVVDHQENSSDSGVSPTVDPSQLVVVGVEDGTTVTITPSIDAHGRPAGVPYTVPLDRFHTYLLSGQEIGDDLTGTRVTSDRPLAVVAGIRCVQIPDTSHPACDRLLEQMPPTSTWGERFVLSGLRGRVAPQAGDLVRVVARDDDTAVLLDGEPRGRLDAGEWLGLEISSELDHELTTSGPALVIQYAKGWQGDGDPMMTTVAPVAQYQDSYTMTGHRAEADDGRFEQWLALAVPATAVTTCMLDGVPITATPTAVGSSEYRALHIQVAAGPHDLACDEPFGLQTYGWSVHDSYGYPGGLALRNVAGPPAPLTTGVGYDGARIVQYSDRIAVAGRLLDNTNGRHDPLPGKPLTVTFADGSTGTTSTDPEGWSRGEVTAGATPGFHSATVNFTGDAQWAPSSVSVPVVVTKEDCVLTYTGTTTSTGKVTLRAQMSERDADPGDLSGRKVTFDIPGLAPLEATTDSTGVAAKGTSLAAGTYEVTATFAGDDHYSPCESAPVTVTVTVTASSEPPPPSPTEPSEAADLFTEFVPADTSVEVGDLVRVTVMAGNGGPASGADAELTLTVPSGWALSGVPSGCELAGTALRCPLGDVAAHSDVVQFTITLVAESIGQGDLQARIDGALPDPSASNDTATLRLEALAPPESSRVAGGSRIATAVAASQDTYPDGTAAAVVLARADDFPDALAGSPFAVALEGPLLLTTPSSLEAIVEEEIRRVLPAGGVIHVLGGTAAVSLDIEERLEDLGFRLRRHGGNDRFATAVAIAEASPFDESIFLATGANFPDALTAGTAAAEIRGAVLLVGDGVVPDATAAFLSTRSGLPSFAAGGPAARAVPAATALVGEDRYRTAVAVAERFFPAPSVVGLATGVNFPDALAGGAHIGRRHGPMLLSAPDALPDPVVQYLEGARASLVTAVLFGGPNALSDAVRLTVEDAIR